MRNDLTRPAGRVISGLCVAAAMFLGACAHGSDDAVRGMPAARSDVSAVVLTSTFEADDTMAAPIVGQVLILEPPQDGSDARHRVRLVMDHVPAGDHAWHIDAGRCDLRNPTTVLDLSVAFAQAVTGRPLTASADGTVDVTFPIPAGSLTVHQLQHGDYSLQVHARAGSNQGRAIACANL